jgi:3-isopropylmalate/(R)-2-methylmalate dehydratase small subunit
MTPFTILTAIAAPLEQENLDTDQIIPARFLHRPRAEDHGAFLFKDLGADPTFVLSLPRWAGAQILVTNRNFGGGSSRESAVYALWDFGIRCLIGPGFGDIFAQNCLKNGLLPVRVSEAQALALRRHLTDSPASLPITVDLPGQAVKIEGLPAFGFTIDPFAKMCLVKGLDEISLTLESRPEIAAFEAARLKAEPWMKI